MADDSVPAPAAPSPAGQQEVTEPPSTAPPQKAAPQHPQLAPGIELIGEYEDSGFKEAPSIARREDGHVIQLSHLLFEIASRSDGHRGLPEIAEEVSGAIGRQVSADNVAFLIQKKLIPLGVLALPDGSAPKVAEQSGMLQLRYRASVVPEGAVRILTLIFRPLFWPVVVVGVLAGLIALDSWLFFIHGVAQSVGQVFNQPLWFLLVIGLIVASTALHETGHATACAYGGAKPGVLGAGIYLVWPVFYSDVTDAYRLGKGGRIRTDLGGVYFNVIFILGMAAFYFLRPSEPLLLVMVIMQIEILHQFMPFVRLDGYYVVADLTGVPDLFPRIKPILASLIPGRKPAEAVTELKNWVRVAVTVWVLFTAAFLLYVYTAMLIAMPRVFGTAWASLSHLGGQLSSAAGHGSYGTALVLVLQMALLALPLIGFAVVTYTTAKALLTAGWTRTAGRPGWRAAFLAATAVVAGLLLWAWVPRSPGQYRPIQPGERGTVQNVLQVAPVVAGLAPEPSPSPSPSPAPSANPGGGPVPSAAPEPSAAPAPATQGGATPVPAPPAPQRTSTPAPAPSSTPPPATPVPAPSPTR